MHKLLLLAATVGLLVAGHPVLAQIDMKAMTLMDGQCRAEIEELQSAVGDCVRYRKNVLGACLPPPPAPWRALDFEKADAELANRSIFARLASFLSPTRNAPLRWALTGVAVLALAVRFQTLTERLV